jgi:TetR/AcrR family transcriptional regulator, regulator of cefoperazone and chloramphenicol sensitivity
MFNTVNMRSAMDRSAAPAIRDAATALFAARGFDAVTVREIAAAAGVSAALVIHHFGSKEGLRRAIDEHVARWVDQMLAQLATAPGDASTLAELMAGWLESEPATGSYLRRLLVDGGPAGAALFTRLLLATREGVGALEAAGVVRPSADALARDVVLLCNDLAAVVLRPLAADALGVDPLGRDGLARWSAVVVDLYTNGLFAGGAP